MRRIKSTFADNFATYIRPIYTIATFTFLVPHYNFDKRFFIKAVFCRLISLAGIAVHIVIFYYSISSSEMSYVIRILPMTSKFLFCTGLALTNAFCLKTTYFNKYNKWRNLFRVFAKIDRQLVDEKQIDKKNHTNLWILLFLFTINLLSLGYESYITIIVAGLSYTQLQIANQLQLVVLFTTVLLMSHIALGIKMRFEMINDSIRKVCERDIESRQNLFGVTFILVKEERKQQIEAQDNVACLRRLSEMYADASDLVGLFNNIFGWQMFCLFVIIFVAILKLFNRIIVTGLDMDDTQGAAVSAGLLIGVIIQVLWAFLLIISCDLTLKEAETTTRMCYKYLKDEPYNREKEILMGLAQQAYFRCPKFSAAQIFEVNISAMFTLFGSVISYVIVLVQFNK